MPRSSGGAADADDEIDAPTLAAWLAALARGDGGWGDRPVLQETVPRCDARMLTLSPAPVRALVFLHVAIGACAGNGRCSPGGRNVVDVRAEHLVRFTALPPLLPYMNESHDVSAQLALSSKIELAPSANQIENHFSEMRAFFKEYVLDDIGTFKKLFDDPNALTKKAMCDAASWLSTNCHGCMSYRLQQAFCQRISEPNESTVPKLSLHEKQELALSSDEILCLKTLDFVTPTTIVGLKSLVPLIARKAMATDQVSDNDLLKLHNHQCQSLHDLAYSREKLYEGMREISMKFELMVANPKIVDTTEISPTVANVEEFEDRNHQDAAEIINSSKLEPLEKILKSSPLNWNWTVQLADRAFNSFRRMKKRNPTAFGPVMKNISMIANGEWTNSVACSLVSESRVVLFESKVLNNLRIVWQVEVAYLEEARKFSQVIRIQTIGNHKDVIDAVENAIAAQRTYSEEHIKRCKKRVIEPSGLHLPAFWDDDDGNSNYIVDYMQLDAEDPVFVLKMHESAVTAKFIPLSKMMLSWIVSDVKDMDDTEFPFSVSKEEDEIIRHENSVIIVGRSGKTSCSVFRLLASFHARAVLKGHENSSASKDNDEGDLRHDSQLRFRQIFVTASPKFCARVYSYYKSLSKSLNPGGNEEALANLIEKISGNTGLNQETENESSSDINTAVESSTKAFHAEELQMQKLPQSFGELKNSDFPLFVPYRKLISMLRVYLGLEEDTVIMEALAASGDTNFESFCEVFKSIDKNLTSGVDSSLAFSEIMGVIKGHEIAASNQDGKLSRDEYVNLSLRAYSMFKDTRHKMYDIFEAYNTKRLERFQQYVNGDIDFVEIPNQLDDLDRVNDVNRELFRLVREKNDKLSEIMVNEVYVDEVQDLAMAQILPLVTLCSDPDHGLVFAGDTAQVIHRGSVFRFQDLSAMIYNSLVPSKTITKAPKVFYLTKNYRSHDGILAVAASVLDLLHRHFPESIDKLPREKGVIAGPQPVIVSGKQAEGDLLSFLAGGKNEGEPIDFGAGQVILVRTLENVNQVKDLLKQSFALVMTVEQAKGMEFRDVVLYNLFADSPGSAQQVNWRLFLGDAVGNLEKFPHFDSQKHNILSAELKLMYTAITRARGQLWIWDSDEKKRYPMFKYWRSASVVVTNDDARSGKFSARGDKTTPEEWNEQGKMLFRAGQYENALQSFKRSLIAAGKRSTDSSFDTLICEAFLRKEEAKCTHSDRSVEAKNFYSKAGDFFKKAGSYGRLPEQYAAEAARCYWTQNSERFQEASEMFELAGEVQIDAAVCFQKVSKFELSGRVLEKLGYFEQALQDYLLSPQSSMEAVSVAKLLARKGSRPSQSVLNRVCFKAISDKRLGKAEKIEAIELIELPIIRRGLYRHMLYSTELANTFATAGEIDIAASIIVYETGQFVDASKYYLNLAEPLASHGIASVMTRFFWILVMRETNAVGGQKSLLQNIQTHPHLGSTSAYAAALKIALTSEKGNDFYAQNSLVYSFIEWFICRREQDPPNLSCENIAEYILCQKLKFAAFVLLPKAGDLGGLYRIASEAVEFGNRIRFLFPLTSSDEKVKLQIVHALAVIRRIFSCSVMSHIPTANLVDRMIFEEVDDVKDWKSEWTVVSDRDLYNLARNSMLQYLQDLCNQFGALSDLTQTTPKLMCVRHIITGIECPINCSESHEHTDVSAERAKYEFHANIVHLAAINSDLWKNNFRKGVEPDLVFKAYVASFHPWHYFRWIDPSLDDTPKIVANSIFCAYKRYFNNILSNNIQSIQLDELLEVCVDFGQFSKNYVLRQLFIAYERVRKSAKSNSQILWILVLKSVRQCVETESELDFVAAALEIMNLRVKYRESLSLSNLRSVCRLAEVVTVVMLNVEGTLPYLMPWRMIAYALKRFPRLLKNPPSRGLLAHLNTAAEIIAQVLEVFSDFVHHETDRNILRLSFCHMILTQHTESAFPPLGTPLWLNGDLFAIMEQVSNIENHGLVLFWRGTLIPSPFVSRAMTIAREMLQLNEQEDRNADKLLASVTEVDRSLTRKAGIEKNHVFESPRISEGNANGTLSFPFLSSSLSLPIENWKNPKTLLQMANSLLNEPTKPQDVQMALDFLTTACNMNDDESTLRLGEVLSSGCHGKVPQNYKTATQCFLKLAEKGNVGAQCSAAKLLIVGGHGLRQNPGKAREIINNAALASEPAAMFLMGESFFRSATPDYSEAFRWFSKAAKANDVAALSREACCLANGYGCRKNIPLALKIYWKIVDVDAEARVNLADIYYEGEHGKPDFDKATRLYEKAVNMDDSTKAMRQLGHICRKNLDYPKAIYWYRQAALKKDGEARRILQSLLREGE
ncbi:hypothetical protein HDU83_004214 [Entophlyctis luteolus]|nr:hypothetical protein HDU83_004214 [Entophlyctis luteolus]